MPKTFKDKKYVKRYTEEAFNNALESIENGWTIFRASKTFNVPRSTLIAHVHNKSMRKRPGPAAVLTNEEEIILTSWLTDCKEKGLDTKISEVHEAARTLLLRNPRENSFKDNLPGKGWYRSFLRRQKNLSSLMNEQSTENETYMRVFTYLKDNNYIEILKNPKRIFMSYETNFNLLSNIKKYFENEATERKDNYTVTYTFNRTQKFVYPMIVYPYKDTTPLEVAKSVPPFYGVANSESGNMTSTTYLSYVSKLFYKFLLINNIERPVLLFVDKTTTTVSLELHEHCKKLGIVIVAFNPEFSEEKKTLVSHLTNLMKKVKILWRNELKLLEEENSNGIQSEKNFASLLEKVNNQIIAENLFDQEFQHFPFLDWLTDMREKFEKYLCVNIKDIKIEQD